MRIPDLFTRGEPVFSFEFFQPKTAEDMTAFKVTVRELKRLDPSFVTITYGAAGSAREKTFETAAMIRSELGVETAAHLTCIAHTKSEISTILAKLRSLGLENVVALRGDAPKDGTARPPEERELPYAADLVRLVRSTGSFAIAVAGYPECHPECPDPAKDLLHFKEKVAAGGDWAITQLFFDNSDYFEFVRRAREAGITVPIVPGIMPVTGYAQTSKFTQMCGAKLPRELVERLAPIAEDREAVIRYGIEYATRQCQELLLKGAPGIHFYTLNRSRSTATILSRLKGWV